MVDKRPKHGGETAQCDDYAGYVELADGTRVSLGVDQLQQGDYDRFDVEIDEDGKGWKNTGATSPKT